MRLATFEVNGLSRIGIVADDDPSLLIDVSSAEGIPSDLMVAVAAGGDAVRLRRTIGQPRGASRVTGIKW